MTKVVFYNSFHKGDLHLSRMMVRKIVQAFPNIEFGYIHRYGAYILKDLPVKYLGWSIVDNRDTSGMVQRGNTFFFNTWYGSYDHTFQNAHGGVTFDALYYIFAKHLEFLRSNWSNIEPDPKNLFPSIDWGSYNKSNIDRFVVENLNKYRKRILFSNGDVLSGQSEIPNFNISINVLSKRFPDVQFICTDKSGVDCNSNVAFTDDFVGVHGCDLNEISYLSTLCDIIIGRSSGPYTYAMISENMFNKNKTMISFSSIGSDNYWLGPSMANQIKYDAEVRNYETNKLDEIIAKIESAIKR